MRRTWDGCGSVGSRGLCSACPLARCRCPLSRCNCPVSHLLPPVHLGKSPETRGTCTHPARVCGHRGCKRTMFHARPTVHVSASAHSVRVSTHYLCKSFPTSRATARFRCRCASIGRACVLSGEQSKQFDGPAIINARARARTTRATIVDPRVRPHSRTSRVNIVARERDSCGADFALRRSCREQFIETGTTPTPCRANGEEEGLWMRACGGG